MNKKHTLNEVRSIGLDKGFILLSNEYINNKQLLEWRCIKNGHKVLKSFNNISRDFDCMDCYNLIRGIATTINSIEKANEFAKNNYNGCCLSTEYKNNKIKLQWMCEKKHIFGATYHNVVDGGWWCAECSGIKRNTLEYVQEFIKQKGGICLFNSYKNNRVKLKIQCKNSHIFFMKFVSVVNGQWCPYCINRHSKAELEIFSLIKQHYPDAENGVSGLLEEKKYEFDIYIPSLSKAIEYDGEYWHYSEWAISKGIPQRDEIKNNLCVNAGIKLLRIKEKEYMADKDAIKKQIMVFLGVG